MSPKVENETIAVSKPKDVRNGKINTIKAPVTNKPKVESVSLRRTPALVGKEIDVNCNLSTTANNHTIIDIDNARGLYMTEKWNVIVSTTSGAIEYNGMTIILTAYRKA